jgi:hypothetical protein
MDSQGFCVGLQRMRHGLSTARFALTLEEKRKTKTVGRLRRALLLVTAGSDVRHLRRTLPTKALTLGRK